MFGLELAELMYIIGTILILPAIIFAFWAQWKVHSAFEEYSKIPSQRGLTGAQVARKLLNENGCTDVQVIKTHGHLSDHYDPHKKVVALSEDVYNSTSLASIGIAGHECGHAIQHHTHYKPLMLRQLVIHSTSFINKMLMPLIIISLFASFFVTSATIMGFPSETFWFVLILAFCVIYAVSFLINLITMPTETNASARAKKLLRQGGYLYDNEEYYGVSRVLGAAAMTYLAGLVISLAYLLRYLGLLLMMVRRD